MITSNRRSKPIEPSDLREFAGDVTSGSYTLFELKHKWSCKYRMPIREHTIATGLLKCFEKGYLKHFNAKELLIAKIEIERLKLKQKIVSDALVAHDKINRETKEAIEAINANMRD